MADTVTSNVINNGPRNYIIHLTNRSDGTGESAVTKVDASTISDASTFSVKSIEYDVQGFSRVDLLYDADTDQPLALLGTGQGYLDRATAFQSDPQATGFTGDIKLTTNGATTSASYDITLHLIKKQ